MLILLSLKTDSSFVFLCLPHDFDIFFCIFVGFFFFGGNVVVGVSATFVIIIVFIAVVVIVFIMVLLSLFDCTLCHSLGDV